MTIHYSTSFGLAVRLLRPSFRVHMYALYAFLRLADEIVDSIGLAKPAEKLKRMRSDTEAAIRDGFSSNPILHAFQHTVRTQGVEQALIDRFWNSMEMDLTIKNHDARSYTSYVHGSAEVVGLMSLRAFCAGDSLLYEELRGAAISLGASFQKINFLRDLASDYFERDRSYFPAVDVEHFSDEDKRKIEEEILKDFSNARKGLSRLPKGSKLAVYVAYTYFYQLLLRIRKLSAAHLLERRVRISNICKLWLMLKCFFLLGIRRL